VSLADPPVTDGARPAPIRVDRMLLEMLVCPVTRGPLVYDSERQELISKGANRAYPIHDGIPVMLVDEARVLED
jgi:uncharacterized protein YbaR (Trm112 family)